MDYIYMLIGAGCAIAGLVISLIATSQARKREHRDEGASSGTILTEIGYIKANTEEIKQEQREQRNNNLKFAERLAAVEGSAKQAHKRIDGLEGKRPREQ